MKLFITSNIPQVIYDKLTPHFDITYHNSNTPLSKEEIIDGIKDVDALLCPLSDKITKEVIDEAKNLKIVANYGAGFDNIDIAYAKEKNIPVTNAPAPSSAVSTAELTFALMLSCARKIIPAYKNLIDGGFYGWRPTYFLGSQLKGKTLGIIGMGNIGRNLAKRASAFDMNVIYYSRNRKNEIESENIKYVDKETVIKESDFISLHSAFAPELKHMISDKEFDAMKETTYFINAARGPLVDEAALVRALQENKIAGAGLDVYEFEPKVTKELLELDNCTPLPHLGNATYEARLEMGHNASDNLIAFTKGEKLPNQVN